MSQQSLVVDCNHLTLVLEFPGFKKNVLYSYTLREKEENLDKSYDKNPYTKRNLENQRATQKRHQKLRLHTNCGPT